MIVNGGRFASLILGAGALWWLAQQGIVPKRNPIYEDQHVIWEHDLNRHGWNDLLNRKDVIICLTWFFVTAGATTTLPADFNTASNQINAIGNGAPGQGGFAGSSTTVCCGGCGGGNPPTTFGGNGGFGGAGGGAGAWAQIQNYALHSAGQVVTVNFTGNVWFHSTSVLLAQSGSGVNPGLASSSVGTLKNDGGAGGGLGPGGTGASGAIQGGGGGGGGGGGAGGPSGAGSTGANGGAGSTPAVGIGGVGGKADGNTVNAGASGSEFDGTHGCGGGGTGGNGDVPGGNSGKYGGGGGGGGGGSGGNNVSTSGNPGQNGGNSFAGLIAIGYTPASGGGGTSRSFAFIVG